MRVLQQLGTSIFHHGRFRPFPQVLFNAAIKVD